MKEPFFTSVILKEPVRTEEPPRPQDALDPSVDEGLLQDDIDAFIAQLHFSLFLSRSPGSSSLSSTELQPL